MSDTVVIAVAAVAALGLFFALWKIIKTVLVAGVIAVVAAGAIYFLLPRLATQDGVAGKAARDTQEVIRTVKKKSGKLGDTVKSTTDSAKKLLDTAHEKVNKAAEAAKEAAEKTKEVADKTKKAAEVVTEKK